MSGFFRCEIGAGYVSRDRSSAANTAIGMMATGRGPTSEEFAFRLARVEDAPAVVSVIHRAFAQYDGELAPPSGAMGETPATVTARLATFHRQTEPLIAYYSSGGLLCEVPGEADVEQVTERTIAAADNIRQR